MSRKKNFKLTAPYKKERKKLRKEQKKWKEQLDKVTSTDELNEINLRLLQIDLLLKENLKMSQEVSKIDRKYSMESRGGSYNITHREIQGGAPGLGKKK